jgi:hypothetical protein
MARRSQVRIRFRLDSARPPHEIAACWARSIWRMLLWDSPVARKNRHWRLLLSGARDSLSPLGLARIRIKAISAPRTASAAPA